MDKEVPIRAISSHMFLLWRLVALLVCLLPHACMGLQLPRALKILPAALKAPFVTRSPLAHHLFEFGTARRNRKMKAIVQQFEADSGVEIYKCDVDAKEDNRQAFLDLVNDLGERTILPMYYNRKSHSVIYGPTDYKNFKRWADGHRHYEKTPALYAYGGIEKSSFAYKLVGYAAKRIFEKAYVSTVPSFMDPVAGPLLQILEVNLTPPREISSIRQLKNSERIFNRPQPIYSAIRTDVIAALLDVMPRDQLGRSAPPRSIASTLHKINKRVRDRLESALYKR